MCGAFQIQHQRREKDKNKLGVIKIKNSAQGAVKWVRTVCIWEVFVCSACAVYVLCVWCVCVRCMCCVCGACICTHVFGRVKPGRTHTEILRVTRQGLGVWKSFDSHNYLFITRMLFFNVLGVYYLWKTKRTEKVPLEAGREGQESHCGAGRQEPWVGTARLELWHKEGQVGGRRVEGGDPRPLEGLLLQDSGPLWGCACSRGPLGLPSTLPSGQALLKAPVLSCGRKALELGSQPQASVPSCPLLAQRHFRACSHSSWAPGGPHTRHPSTCRVMLHPRPFPRSWAGGWATA